MKRALAFASVGLALAVAGCQTTYTAAEKVQPLEVSFADPAWDGVTVPAGQHCQPYGGHGATPPMIVSNLPDRANAVIVEFNDRSFPPLSRDGGHGKIGFWVEPGAGEATLRPVPGMTGKIPEGTFIEAAARSTGSFATGGYLPPCSGGGGNHYFAIVKAVYKPKVDGETALLLGEGRIELGRY